MIGRPGWVVARWVRRAAWWVFVVVALVAGRVSWLDLGDGRAVIYRGSYVPFTDATTSGAFTTTLDVSYDIGGDGAWVSPVTAVAAGVAVVAAVVQGLLTRRSPLVTLVTVLAAPAAIVAVVAAVNGIAGISFAPLVAAALVLAAIALHEAATGAARPPRHP